MGVAINISGKLFGRLRVLEQVSNRGRYRAWLCLCKCGNRSIVTTQKLRSGNTKSCGCFKIDLIRRRRLITHPKKVFWSRVREAGPNECWQWSGKSNSSGYGNFRGEGAHVAAHRFGKKRPIGELCILHTCDNRMCCNPKHLFLGTHKDNSIDAWQKGRNFFQQNPDARPRGEAHAGAVFTWEKVRRIRKLYRTGKYRQIDIARQFNSTQAAISQIVRNVAWKE